MEQLTTVRGLLDFYGSNKGVTYEGLYDVLLGPIRRHVRTLIEIGVGTMTPGLVSTMVGFAIDDNYRPGGSLRAFRDFLPNADIIGFDVANDCQITDDRISTWQANSSDPLLSLPKILPKITADVIIDDGCHELENQLGTLENFWPLLRVGGIYVIEDVYPQNEGAVHAALPADCVHFSVRPAPGLDWMAFVLKKTQS